MRIILTEEFEKQYFRLPNYMQLKAEKQQIIFANNPFHPSLHTEKLTPKSKNVWSFRVDKRYRVIFKFAGDDKVYFLTIGPHDWVYKNNF
jgi:mRNA-degrading endonuclease RelE of RelBE toxin-antitoxin system